MTFWRWWLGIIWRGVVPLWELPWWLFAPDGEAMLGIFLATLSLIFGIVFSILYHPLWLLLLIAILPFATLSAHGFWRVAGRIELEFKRKYSEKGGKNE